MTNSTTSLQETIANRQLDKTNNPIGNRETVDRLLEDYGSLIHLDYKGWFAKRFYYLDQPTVARLASEAKADGKHPQRLFSFLVGKEYKKRTG